MKWLSFEAVASVAYKEFLHIYRDRRVLLLVLTFPPLFTLLFGHAFETGELTGVPSLLVDQDNTPRAQQFIEIISKNKTFRTCAEVTPFLDFFNSFVVFCRPIAISP